MEESSLLVQRAQADQSALNSILKITFSSFVLKLKSHFCLCHHYEFVPQRTARRLKSCISVSADKYADTHTLSRSYSVLPISAKEQAKDQSVNGLQKSAKDQFH